MASTVQYESPVSWVKNKHLMSIMACFIIIITVNFTIYIMRHPLLHRNGQEPTIVAHEKFTNYRTTNTTKEISKKMLKNLTSCCQKIGRKDATCGEIFSSLQKCRAEFVSYEIKKILPNFFLTSLANNASIEPYRKANVAYVHLPKCGGTSVEKHLSNLMKEDWEKSAIIHCRDFRDVICKAKPTLKRKFFYAKRTYGLHNFFTPDRPFLYFTWFRDPIKRVVSTYYYLKKTLPVYHHYVKKDIKPSSSLESFLKRTKNAQVPDFNNFNVRLMQFGDDPALDRSFEDCCGVNFKEIPAVNETHYMTAKKNLLNMAFIGNLEDWMISQEMLDFMLGFTVDSSETHINTNLHNDSLTKYERTEIIRRNKWDILLYKDVMELYDKQKKAYLLYKAASEKHT